MFISKEKYKACIYTRPSKDDGDKPESDSIGNQKALIRDFIKAHPEIEVVSEKERNKNLDIRQKVDAAL